ncbi:MAG: hypothetical protein L3K19_03320 [Thermoplasmata archaeon]|nr:hypothetical protein [Thermoplasmata archaeon]
MRRAFGELVAPTEADLRFALGALRVRFRELWKSPRTRRLRWIVLIGLAARLILAPITSWGIDTPDFILSGLDLIYTGSPYSSTLYFNPPLGPLLSAPLYALASAFFPTSSLVPTFDSITPAVVATGLTSNLVPSPTALLALKLPLILADVASTLVIFQLVSRFRSAREADLASAIWFLNPLLIWATAVHGEVDGLATLFMLLFLAALVYDWPLASGVVLALAISAKAYPAVLIPLGLLVFLMRPRGTIGAWRSRLVTIGQYALGLGLGVVPFLLYLGPISQSLAGGSASGVYGGLSVLVVYNGAVPRFFPPFDVLQLRQYAPGVLMALRLLVVVGIVGVLALFVRARWSNWRSWTPLSLPLVATVALSLVVGVVLFDSTPQSENMVGPLALVLLATPWLGRAGLVLYGLLSAAAFGLYMALLTPLAYFYPLAVMMGPGAVNYVNAVAIGFDTYQGPFNRGTLWLLVGCLGGSCLIAMSAISAWRLVRPPSVEAATT